MTDLTRPKATAEALQISIATLYRWRKLPRFPQPVSIGKVVFYDVPAIKQWLSVEGGKLYSTIYGTEYTPELLAQCVAVKPELNYWKLMPNGRTEQVYYATHNKQG